jgi:hypothetical protein
VLAAAAAIQVRPEPKFFTPLPNFIGKLTDTQNLNGIRMRIVYRLVMALQNIARADNERPEQVVTDAQRMRDGAVPAGALAEHAAASGTATPEALLECRHHLVQQEVLPSAGGS